MSYEAAVRRLEEIVSLLAGGAKPLSESLALFEEGIRLLSLADAALAGVEARARELIEGGRASDEE